MSPNTKQITKKITDMVELLSEQKQAVIYELVRCLLPDDIASEFLDELPRDNTIKGRLKQFDELTELINSAVDEEMPPIERIKLREVEL